MYIVRVHFISGNVREFPFKEKDMADTFYQCMLKDQIPFGIITIERYMIKIEEVANA